MARSTWHRDFAAVATFAIAAACGGRASHDPAAEWRAHETGLPGTLVLPSGSSSPPSASPEPLPEPPKTLAPTPELAAPNTSLFAGSACGVAAMGGELVVAGTFGGTIDYGVGSHRSAGGQDVFVGVFSADGVARWIKTFGGTDDDACPSLAVDGQGHVLLSRQELPTAPQPPSSPANSVLVELDKDGNELGTTRLDTRYSRLATTVGMTWISGSLASERAWVVAPRAATGGVGQPILRGESTFVPAALSADAAGLAIGGAFDGDLRTPSQILAVFWDRHFVVARHRNDGTLDWFRLTSEEPRVVRALAGGRTLVATECNRCNPKPTSSASTPTVQVFDATGSVEWRRAFPGVPTPRDDGFGTVTALAADGAGNLFVAGWMSTIDFGDRVQVASGLPDAFVVKLDPLGRTIWSGHCGGTELDSAVGLAVLSSGRAYVVGYATAPGTIGGKPVPAPSGWFLMELPP